MNKKKKKYRQKLKNTIWLYKHLDREAQVFISWCFSKKDCTYNEYIEREGGKNERLSNIIKE